MAKEIGIGCQWTGLETARRVEESGWLFGRRTQESIDHCRCLDLNSPECTWVLCRDGASNAEHCDDPSAESHSPSLQRRYPVLTPHFRGNDDTRLIPSVT